jgi:hypothetical protein
MTPLQTVQSQTFAFYLAYIIKLMQFRLKRPGGLEIEPLNSVIQPILVKSKS